MAVCIFGVGRGHLGKRAMNITHKHGASLVNYTDHEEQKHWFTYPNPERPFDHAVEQAVLDELTQLDAGY